MTDAAKPRVAVIGTGGTISSVGRSSLDLVTYMDTKKLYEVDELLDRFPEAYEVADVVPVRFRAIISPAIGPADWLELNAFIHETVAKDPALDGVAVTHGTAALEETAYFLNLTLKVDVPVVIVGSQRPASGLSTDAALNLFNAVRVAGCAAARGRGVLVLLNEEIHAAREVTKTSTMRLQTFRAPDFGMLGHADADRIAFYRMPERRRAPETEFDLDGLAKLPRVDIVPTYAGSDRTALDAFVAAGAEGLVSSGFPPGFCTPGEYEGFVAAAERGVIIVQSSRAGSGRIPRFDLLRAPGCVNADNLTPQKARVLLMLALTRSKDPAEIQRMFDTY